VNDIALPERGRVSGMIAAAGAGERLGGQPKAFLQANGITLLERAVALLEPWCGQLIAGVRAEECAQAERLLGNRARVLAGGATRQDTLATLLAPATGEFVLLHDVARPFASAALIRRVLEAAAAHGAAAPALPFAPGDSLALRNGDWLGESLPREHVIGTQTPYAFRRELLLAAYARSQAEGWQETSTTTLLTRAGIPVHLVPGEPGNWKITYTDDWDRARSLLAVSSPAGGK
jgi:2-C-methyl-D-erythritol 4-phosphate cytidylyltransferase